MRKKIVITFVLLCTSLSAIHYYSIEDPKSYLTRIRPMFDFSSGTFSIETKISEVLEFYAFKYAAFGMMGSITMYISPEKGGLFPIDHLYGAFGLYAEITNLQHVKFSIYPIAHESAHLVDGYKGDIDADRVPVSHEYTGADVFYVNEAWGLQTVSGIIFYVHRISRPLVFRIHGGLDVRVPLYKRINYVVSAHIALFYEKGIHPALNFGTGIEFPNCHILLHYEYQRGLAQDYNTTYNRLGGEIVIPWTLGKTIREFREKKRAEKDEKTPTTTTQTNAGVETNARADEGTNTSATGENTSEPNAQ